MATDLRSTTPKGIVTNLQQPHSVSSRQPLTTPNGLMANNYQIAGAGKRSLTTAATITTTTTATTKPTPSNAKAKKNLTDMTDEEIIEKNLKEILDKQSREERKANGRFIAVIVAFLVIFLSVYHAWIRKTHTALAGVLVPAVIMLSYGAWVIILAKRDKHKRAAFERHLEEVALKNKTELETKARLKQIKANKKNKNQKRNNRKRRQHQQQHHHLAEVLVHGNAVAAAATTLATGKRPSIRQKLFGGSPKPLRDVETGMAASAIAATAAVTAACGGRRSDKTPATSSPMPTPTVMAIAEKRKRFKRLDSLPTTHMVRMSSTP